MKSDKYIHTYCTENELYCKILLPTYTIDLGRLDLYFLVNCIQKNKIKHSVLLSDCEINGYKYYFTKFPTCY